MQATLLGLYDTIYVNENFLVLLLLPESCCLHKYWFLSLISLQNPPQTNVKNINGIENLQVYSLQDQEDSLEKILWVNYLDLHHDSKLESNHHFFQ